MRRALNRIADEDFPWLGSPREYSALAMPQGDHRLGMPEPCIQLTERRGEQWLKYRLLSVGEARALLDAIEGALAVFDHGPALLAELDAPVPAAGRYPYPHRPLSEVDAR